MRKFLFGFLVVAFFLLPGHAGATTTACPALQPVYITSGGNILCVETASGGSFGMRTVLATDSTSAFEDLAFGPDGDLYATDSLGNRVFRFDPSSASTLTLVATLPSNATPAGLAFSGSDGDLHVITNIGVFRLQRIASLFAPLVTIPTGGIALSTPDISLSITAGGNAFGETGTLLIVNQAGKGTVLSSEPVIGALNPYPSITNSSLITNFANKPTTTSPGIAVNTCADILLGSANVIKRFGSDGTLLNASFASPAGTNSKDIFQYMEVDANNVLWAVTNNTSGSTDTGILWRIDPVVVSGGDPITSCASGTATQVGTAIAGGASGLALPPTSHTVTHSFGAGTSDTCPTSGFNATDTTKTYLFGHHSWSVTYKSGILACFPQTFTAARVRPIDVAFCTGSTCSPSSFQAGTRCALYPSMGGFCVQYLDTSTTPPFSPPPTTDYNSGIRIKVGFFDPLGLFIDPGLADCPDSFPNTGTNACNNDISHDFYPAVGPGTDPSDAGDVPIWPSRFVVFNEPLNATFLQPTTLTLHSPVSSCKPLPCNPKFNFGQNIKVSFNLVDMLGNTIPNAFERLSVVRTSYTPTFAGGPPQVHIEKVVSTNNSNVDNIFSTGSGGLYVYNLDSSFFQALPKGTVAIYQFTIFGNGHQIDSSTVFSVTVAF